MTDQDLKAQLTERAAAEGFAKCGVMRPQDLDPIAAGRLQAYVAAKRHGQMTWMAERMAWRGSPSALWPEAKSVIMLAELYSPTHDPLEILDRKEHGAISVYAQNRDYHDVVKKRQKRLGRWLIDQSP